MKEMSQSSLRDCERYLDLWIQREAPGEGGVGCWELVSNGVDDLGAAAARFKNKELGVEVAVSKTPLGWVPVRISEEQLKAEARAQALAKAASSKAASVETLAVVKNVEALRLAIEKKKAQGVWKPKEAAQTLVKIFERCYQRGQEDYEPSPEVVELLAKEAKGEQAKNWEHLRCGAATLAARYGNLGLLRAARKHADIWKEDEGDPAGSSALAQAGLHGNKPMADQILEWMIEDVLDGKQTKEELELRVRVAKRMSEDVDGGGGLEGWYWSAVKSMFGARKEARELDAVGERKEQRKEISRARSQMRL